MDLLAEAEKRLYVPRIYPVNQAEVREVSFLLLGFLCQDVAFESVLSLDFSGAGKGKPFLRCGICLNLWHFFILIN